MNENSFSNEDTIIIIRTFLLKAKRLLNLRKNIKLNPNLETVISNYKPSIFWKEKEIVKQQLKIWSEDNLRKLINEINSTELLIKKNISISLNILLNFVFTNSKIVNN
jgi:DNA polymerase-3 subunit delta